jgi:hypothetical protein
MPGNTPYIENMIHNEISSYTYVILKWSYKYSFLLVGNDKYNTPIAIAVICDGGTCI